MADGFHDYVAGDVLTAVQVDDYLMRQTVMRFADASARDSALSGVLVEGLYVYLKDNNRLMVYDGSVWRGVRQVYFTATGTAVTTSGLGVATTATISVPDQGCAGVLMVWAHLRYDQSVTTDVFTIAIRQVSTEVGTSDTTVVGNIQFAHISAPMLMTAGSGTTVNLILQRSSGTGTASTYTNGLINRLDAIFTPTP